jgi:hypothetical protein
MLIKTIRTFIAFYILTSVSVNPFPPSIYKYYYVTNGCQAPLPYKHLTSGLSVPMSFKRRLVLSE